MVSGVDGGDGGRSRREPLTRVFFALTFVVYIGVFPYLARLNNPNENVRTYMTMALVEEATLRIDAMVARHGWVNDMAKIAGPAPGESHLYSVKGPAVSYAGVPFYWLFTKVAPAFGRPIPGVDAPEEARARWLRDATFFLRIVVVQLPCFAFLVALERWLRGTTRDLSLRLTAVAAVGLGTNYLAYSHMFASHALTAATAFASFALATNALAARDAASASPTPRHAYAAGLAAALTTLLDYHTLPLTLLLAAYAAYSFRTPRLVVAVALGLLGPALLMLHFQWRAFGSPFATGHRSSENESYAALLQQGFLGLGIPNGRAARLLALSRSFGLFGTAPFMALGLLAIPFGLLFSSDLPIQRTRERIVTGAWLTGMALLWLTVSAAVNWRGGWTIGPRYLGAAPPFFAYGAVTGLEQLRRLRPRAFDMAAAVAAGTMLAGVVQTGVVSLFVSSLPEEIARPLPQLVAPFVREGLVPYHFADALFAHAVWPWLALVALLLAAAVLAAVAGVPRAKLAAHLVVAGIVAGALVVPIAMDIPATPGGEESPEADMQARRRALVGSIRDAWEPALPR